jgi:hypothetical protein
MRMVAARRDILWAEVSAGHRNEILESLQAWEFLRKKTHLTRANFLKHLLERDL